MILHDSRNTQRAMNTVWDHTKRVPSLQHEALDDSVENDAIIIAVLAVGGPVLHSLGALLREQLEMDVAPGGVHDGYPWQRSTPTLCRGGTPSCQHVICCWLLIEYIPADVHPGFRHPKGALFVIVVTLQAVDTG